MMNRLSLLLALVVSLVAIELFAQSTVVVQSSGPFGSRQVVRQRSGPFFSRQVIRQRGAAFNSSVVAVNNKANVIAVNSNPYANVAVVNRAFVANKQLVAVNSNPYAVAASVAVAPTYVQPQVAFAPMYVQPQAAVTFAPQPMYFAPSFQAVTVAAPSCTFAVRSCN